MNYIAFIAGLPEISWDDRKLSLTVAEFREQAKNYVRGKDEKLLELFFLPNDNLQVLRLLSRQDALSGLPSVFSLRQLEEEVQEPSGILPDYLTRFIRDFKEERMEYDTLPENVLSWRYYDYMLKADNELVRRYAELSMNLRNFVAAWNSRKYGRDVAREVIGNNEIGRAHV